MRTTSHDLPRCARRDVDGLMSGVVSSRMRRKCFGRYPVAFGSVTAVGTMFGRGLGAVCRAHVDCPRLGGWKIQRGRPRMYQTHVRDPPRLRGGNQTHSQQKYKYDVPSSNKSFSALPREILSPSSHPYSSRPCQLWSQDYGGLPCKRSTGSMPIRVLYKQRKRTCNCQTIPPNSGPVCQLGRSRALFPNQLLWSSRTSHLLP